MTESIIRLPVVQQRTGLSRSEIYRKESISQFPQRVRLGARSVGWVSSEVQAWIEARIQLSRTATDRKTSFLEST